MPFEILCDFLFTVKHAFMIAGMLMNWHNSSPWSMCHGVQGATRQGAWEMWRNGH